MPVRRCALGAVPLNTVPTCPNTPGYGPSPSPRWETESGFLAARVDRVYGWFGSVAFTPARV